MSIPSAPAEPTADDASDRPVLGVVRCGLVALSALGLLGAGTALSARGIDARHLAAWLGLGMLAAATVLFVVPGRRSMRWVRVLCLLVLGAAAFSVAEHLLASAGPAGIDRSVSAYWASLSPLTRSWYGVDDLGPSTPLVPGMLGQAALLLVLATFGGGRSPRPTTAPD
jgi:hypothetical protein